MCSVSSICCASCHSVSSVLEMVLFTANENGAMLPVMGSTAPSSWKTLSGCYYRMKGEQVGFGPSVHRWQRKHHHLLPFRCSLYFHAHAKVLSYWRQGMNLALLVRGRSTIHFGGLLLTFFILPYNRPLSLL